MLCWAVPLCAHAAAGELVLWGATLWDPRVPAPLHTFDQLSTSAGGAGGIFHPNGGEIILNSEVRGVLSGKTVTGTGTGFVTRKECCSIFGSSTGIFHPNGGEIILNSEVGRDAIWHSNLRYCTVTWFRSCLNTP